MFMGTNTSEHADLNANTSPTVDPAVFSQTVILSSLISQQSFSLFNDTDGWRHTIA
jgi:hypothetical protein